MKCIFLCQMQLNIVYKCLIRLIGHRKWIPLVSEVSLQNKIWSKNSLYWHHHHLRMDTCNFMKVCSANESICINWKQLERLLNISKRFYAKTLKQFILLKTRNCYDLSAHWKIIFKFEDAIEFLMKRKPHFSNVNHGNIFMHWNSLSYLLRMPLNIDKRIVMYTMRIYGGCSVVVLSH